MGHPWIYRAALAPSSAAVGSVVDVLDPQGGFVARGFVDGGAIGVRVLATTPIAIDDAFWRERVRIAAALRRRVVPPHTTAYRLLAGEGDRVPGVHADVYGDVVVVKLDGDGVRSFARSIVAAIVEEFAPETVLLREGRGDDKKVNVVHGSLPAARVVVLERGMKLEVDLIEGQKTGMFLDHRESRHRVRTLAEGLSVLNLYGYTGGFSIAAGLGGAREVHTVDVAKKAIELAESNWRLNDLEPAKHRGFAEDVPAYLERLRETRGRYDLVIADPPSFAPNEAAVPQAMRSYRALHRASLRLVAPGGLYLAASCSSHIDRARFEQSIYEGAEKARRAPILLERWNGPADHPRPLAFPEGDYLKCLLFVVP